LTSLNIQYTAVPSEYQEIKKIDLPSEGLASPLRRKDVEGKTVTNI
jgi:hypothetical protein